MKLTDIDMPDTPAARAAHEVVAHFAPPALVNHCLRSYVFAAALGELRGIAIDHELLFVSTMLHDLALEPAFDNVGLPFEHAGAHLAWMFAAGLGWDAARRDRAGLIIVDHMNDDTDPAVDPEGYVLALATSLDISGRDAPQWPAGLLAEAVAAYPRLDLADRFAACFASQAERKPQSQAARAVQSGIADRLRMNPLETLTTWRPQA